jgi:hypothetical protein
MSLQRTVLACVGLTAVLCRPAAAEITFTSYASAVEVYVDFSAESRLSGHRSWDAWIPPGQSTTARYMDFRFLAGGDHLSGSCYELFFSAAAGTPLATDIRVWALMREDGTWRSVDDDGPYPDRLPRVRLWTDGSRHLFGQVRISAYSGAYNDVDFSIYAYVSDKSPWECDDGVTAFYNFDWDYINQPDTIAN